MHIKHGYTMDDLDRIRRDAETNVGHLANYTDTLIDLTADLDHARAELDQERVRRQNLAERDAEINDLRAEIARGEQGWRLMRDAAAARSAERDQALAELAWLRERAAVLPDNWRTQINATRPTQITTRIESWRPSTGDTAGPAEQWRLDEREIDGGFAGTEYPRLWPPRQAALPDGHAEPEPAWGEGRPVHGHTEQTGDQT